MTGRHVPARTCVACRTRREQGELLRVVRGPDGRVALDRLGGLPGRGAYLCRDGACWGLALRRGSLERALRASLPAAIRMTLEQGLVPDRAGAAGGGLTAGPGAAATTQGGTHGAQS